jgi:hypothetical protein
MHNAQRLAKISITAYCLFQAFQPRNLKGCLQGKNLQLET